MITLQGRTQVTEMVLLSTTSESTATIGLHLHMRAIRRTLMNCTSIVMLIKWIGTIVTTDKVFVLSQNLHHMSIINSPHRFSITKEQLLIDLYKAYKLAKKHKSKKKYQLAFEFNLEDNLIELRDDLLSCKYEPSTYKCFIVHEPKMREVFASDFRDRIVHHLFYSYTHIMFERTFIYDSYSCIKKRGTHFGISRLKHHLQRVSAGYTKPCYVLKIDIKGYFMSIDKQLLLSICNETLQKMANRKSDSKNLKWNQKLDFRFLGYLLEKIIKCDPTIDCIMIGEKEDWDKLPIEKSLFHSNENCGLPIGNLSSQLFSNIYMNKFDQYVKRDLGCQNYGRYVDDAYIVSNSKQELHSLIPLISDYLLRELKLKLQLRKTRIYDAKYGVEFLGAFIKPYRSYIANSTKKRIEYRCKNIPKNNRLYLRSSINSMFGLLAHYNSYCCRKIIAYKANLYLYGSFSKDMKKFMPFIK